jgi:hypothetical protein
MIKSVLEDDTTGIFTSLSNVQTSMIMQYGLEIDSKASPIEVSFEHLIEFPAINKIQSLGQKDKVFSDLALLSAFGKRMYVEQVVSNQYLNALDIQRKDSKNAKGSSSAALKDTFSKIYSDVSAEIAESVSMSHFVDNISGRVEDTMKALPSVQDVLEVIKNMNVDYVRDMRLEGISIFAPLKDADESGVATPISREANVLAILAYLGYLSEEKDGEADFSDSMHPRDLLEATHKYLESDSRLVEIARLFNDLGYSIVLSKDNHPYVMLSRDGTSIEYADLDSRSKQREFTSGAYAVLKKSVSQNNLDSIIPWNEILDEQNIPVKKNSIVEFDHFATRYLQIKPMVATDEEREDRLLVDAFIGNLMFLRRQYLGETISVKQLKKPFYDSIINTPYKIFSNTYI